MSANFELVLTKNSANQPFQKGPVSNEFEDGSAMWDWFLKFKGKPKRKRKKKKDGNSSKGKKRQTTASK